MLQSQPAEQAACGEPTRSRFDASPSPQPQRNDRANPNAELSQYISWALLSTGPPSFALKTDFPAPPDAASLDNFALLISQFYQEANIGGIWKQVQPYYDAEIDRYHEPVTNAVLQVNAYLRNVTSGYVGRRFQVYVDVLGAPNQVQTRNYVDDYYVVVTPATEMPIDDIRHAYLHYLLDPVGIKYSDDLKMLPFTNELPVTI